MKKFYLIIMLILLTSIFSCTNNSQVDVGKQDSTNKIGIIDSSGLSFSDYYNNNKAGLLFFKINFKYASTRDQYGLSFSVPTMTTKIGKEYTPISGWISSSTTNDDDDDDNWHFRVSSFSSNQFVILGSADKIRNTQPHNLEGQIGIAIAYKERNSFASSQAPVCDVIYFCGKKFSSLSKHNITIDGKKYTYKINDADITKDKVVDYVKSVCQAGNIDIETGLSEDWEFECP